MKRYIWLCTIVLCSTTGARGAEPQPIESIWLEAEHLQGLKGTCWPMGTPAMQRTEGHWGISGPGWAAEWSQGGESGFLSIACAADDDKATATADILLPVEANYYVWVRYADVRDAPNRFQLLIEQAEATPWTATYGQHPLFDEDNMMKLFWGWAFGWEVRPAHLEKGKARLTLRSAFKDTHCRQIDCIVLTTDPSYRPFIKERPRNYTWDVLNAHRKRERANSEGLTRTKPPLSPSELWKVRTFQDQGFLFLWNVNQFDWLTDRSDRILYPHRLSMEEADRDVLVEFKKKYAAKTNVPIFSDPRIVPVFHGAGPRVLDDAPAGQPGGETAHGFTRWLENHPRRAWATMMNYLPATAISPPAVDRFQKHRERYVGSISGENLGYFDEYVDQAAKQAAIANSKTRRELAEALGKVLMQANATKWRKVYGKDIENPYREVIPVIGMDYYPLCFHWGARTVGCEMVSVTGCMQGMNLAMLRGAARQYGGMVLTYRSGNFGDSSASFSHSSYATVKQLLDNYYSPYSGAGMTWWKLDGWYQYMAGSAMFYEEGGQDAYWKPGGLTAAGIKEVQLSPRGKLTDRFLQLTAKQPDRGAPYTPVAILMDYAHGYSVSPYYPSLFEVGDVARWSYTAAEHVGHARNLQEILWLAYHPIGPRSQGPLTAMTESFVPGVFGDIFDVFYADPAMPSWQLLHTYPLTIVAGDIELTVDEGRKLNEYIRSGGTLVAADGQLRGPGADALELPKLESSREAAGYRWLAARNSKLSQRYSFRPIVGGRPLATTPGGLPVCTAHDRGKGRLVFLSVPYALGLDKQVVPIMAELVADCTRGLMPVEVVGDVQWLVNRTPDGWLVTLINSAGDMKPQQGIFPVDFRENRTVSIRSQVPIASAKDRLLESDKFTVENNAVSVLVPAGGVRIMELK